jgi:hypothetical protein
MGGPASSIGDECFAKPAIQEQVGILQCIAATQIPAHAGSSVEYFSYKISQKVALPPLFSPTNVMI